MPIKKLLFTSVFVVISLICIGQSDTTKTKPSIDKRLIEENRGATFPGGATAMIKYVDQQMIYPEDAFKKKIEGRVFTSFVIEPNGDLSNIRVEGSLHPSLDEEALRILKTMPRWNPGMVNGEIVRTRLRLPIVFDIEKEKKKKTKAQKKGALKSAPIISIFSSVKQT